MLIQVAGIAADDRLMEAQARARSGLALDGWREEV